MSKKIYPQDVQGKYRRIKNHFIIVLLSVYFFGSWIRYERGKGLPNQALLIDLPNRTAYFLGIEIWPQETYYMTGILIIAALGLFLFTSLFGRVWCGYTCPQTVFTDIFIKIESYFQGDRNARIKLDSTAYNPKNKTKDSYLYNLGTSCFRFCIWLGKLFL